MNKQIEKIIKAELALHPRASLQDFYKLFFQSFFGAEHALTDPDSARKYFDNELENLPQKSDLMIQDISVNFSIYRVNLHAIVSRLISSEELFEAFLKSTQTHIKTSKEEWPDIWKRIEDILTPILKPSKIESEKLYDVAKNGNTVHHSQIYKKLYSPHYRIICGEFLPNVLKAGLESQRMK